MKRLNVDIEETTYRDFKTKATSQEISVSELVRTWIKRFLKGEI